MCSSDLGLFDGLPPTSDLLTDSMIYSKFKHVLEGNVENEPIVVAEDLGVQIFHFLMRRLPVKYSDPLLLKFVKYPSWKETNTFACVKEVDN